MKKTFLILCFSILPLFSLYPAAYAEWSTGIGTGLSQNWVDAKQGFDTHDDNVGAVEYNVTLDPVEIRDYTETAFGFGGYLLKDIFLIQYSIGYIRLGGDGKISKDTMLGPVTVESDLSFSMLSAEATLGVPVYKAQYILLIFDGGARYTRHELDTEIDISGVITRDYDRTVTNYWIDPVLGITFRILFTENIYLNNRLNAGYFGSDGTYFATTALMWKFHEHVSMGLTGKYAKINYEIGGKGDKDWYIYEATETAFGINFIIIF